MADREIQPGSLLQFRDALLEQLAAADLEFSRVRMTVERMESDMRIGRPEPAEYAETKGQLLPRAESRVVDAFRELLKIEDKIIISSR